ncbi:unnamed protein product [Chilo suppressalis]|uniref:G-protein coupled receptors family 1 profile domain-containing protein n=1 Tax=Chilo suppressalis TaxID=168631 RepID=A0ABN8APN7_CHISP|nr:unnamed protein product [Chilo suppressalis]
MRELAPTPTFIAVINTSITRVSSNAYEWRFILPPYFLIFMLSVTGNCMVTFLPDCRWRCRHVNMSVDVWTLVAISLERYFAICRPLKSRKWQTQCHAYKMIAMVWMLSVALNSPILIVSTLQPMKANGER